MPVVKLTRTLLPTAALDRATTWRPWVETDEADSFCVYVRIRRNLIVCSSWNMDLAYL